jgi:hypothetical protein
VVTSLQPLALALAFDLAQLQEQYLVGDVSLERPACDLVVETEAAEQEDCRLCPASDGVWSNMHLLAANVAQVAQPVSSRSDDESLSSRPRDDVTRSVCPC